MTENEILMLVTGITLGAQMMNLLHMYWEARDDRREAEAARRRRRIHGANCFLNSLRLYQLQARYAAAHPAETFEASVRDFELDLRDGLDRVERAARDEGLL